MKKLPIGISTIDKIINGDCVYVYKTQIALKLIEDGGGYFFLILKKCSENNFQ
ncbi:MAG: hypothetical protein ACQESP_05295 [Candidatus Muiribacteriota bacterium]